MSKNKKYKYPLIPITEITDEARKIAVSWVDNYQPQGMDIPNKHKLASDIMNYAKQEAIEFAKFVNLNTIRNGDDEWRTRFDNYKKDMNTDQLYNLFIKESSQTEEND